MNELYTWGRGNSGILGHGDESTVVAPKAVDLTLLQGQEITHMSSNASFTLAVSKRGEVFSWGNGKAGTLGHSDLRSLTDPRKIRLFKTRKVSMVAAGREHSLCTLQSGEVYAWGSNSFGQLGLGHRDTRAEPQQVTWFQRSTLEEMGEASEAASDDEQEDDAMQDDADFVGDEPIFIVSVAAGSYHSLVVDAEGLCFSWGLNNYGQQGHNDFQDRVEPKVVRVLAEQRIKVSNKISAGAHHSAVLTNKGQVFTWGDNRSMQLGGVSLNASESRMMPRPLKVIQWMERHDQQFVSLHHVPFIIDLSCGNSHTLALSEDGDVFSWGRGDLGRLGHNDTLHRAYPHKIDGLDSKGVVSIAVGGYHSMALTQAGRIFVFGSNDHGQLGLPSEQGLFITRPTEIPSTVQVHFNAIFAGTMASMALGENRSNEERQARSCVVQ